MSAIDPLAYLRPALLGANWNVYYGCSAFSGLWRAARLNMCSRSNLRRALGVTLNQGDDCFRKTTFSPALQSGLQAAYPDAFDGGRFWDVKAWWPYGGPIPWEAMPWRLRCCPACSRSCYHSLLFQMPGVHRCPWHRMELIDTCPRCDRDLMAGFREGLPLGRCACGHDLVDYVAAVEGDQASSPQKVEAIDGFSLCAASSRRVTYLVAPEPWDSHAWDALHALFPRPAEAWLTGQHSCLSRRALILETIRLERSLRHKSPPMSANSGLDAFTPGIAMLPIGWQPAIKAIGSELLSMLPSGSLEGASPGNELRQALTRLPVYPCGRFTFLHTETLDRGVLRTLGTLSAALSASSNRGTRRPELAQRIAEHPLGSALLKKTIQRVLMRGYADGARVVLGRHAPELYRTIRSRPVVRLPWVLLWLPFGRMPSAQVAWTRQRGTH